MSLEPHVTRLNDRWLHASGGVLWHLRALRYRNTLWRPFRLTVQQWLHNWQPPADKLLIVGPSAGYTLDPVFLQRWREVVVLEPDPLARLLLRKRYRAINWRFENRDVLNSDRAQFARCFGEHAVLFANVLGQVSPRANTAANQWMQNLRRRLKGTHWASYHDVISTARAPDKPLEPWFPLGNVTLDEAISQFWQGGEIEVVDHYSFSLGSPLNPGEHANRAYCVWPLRPSQYHLVEWLSGTPMQP